MENCDNFRIDILSQHRADSVINPAGAFVQSAVFFRRIISGIRISQSFHHSGVHALHQSLLVHLLIVILINQIRNFTGFLLHTFLRNGLFAALFLFGTAFFPQTGIYTKPESSGCQRNCQKRRQRSHQNSFAEIRFLFSGRLKIFLIVHSVIPLFCNLIFAYYTKKLCLSHEFIPPDIKLSNVCGWSGGFPENQCPLPESVPLEPGWKTLYSPAETPAFR